MKVKCNTDELHHLTKGNIYDGVLCRNGMQLLISMDNGESDTVHTDWFDVVPDTPQIEVGSEWVDPWRHTCTVLGVGEEEVFIKNHTMNLEHTYKKDKFLAELKPKPKTVKMYFYKDKDGRISATDYDIKYSEYIFTKEIEL